MKIDEPEIPSPVRPPPALPPGDDCGQRNSQVVANIAPLSCQTRDCWNHFLEMGGCNPLSVGAQTHIFFSSAPDAFSRTGITVYTKVQ